MKIEARAPTRIDLAGGTLDIWPLYLFHPGSVTVNCAITLQASCVIETRPGASIELISLDTRKREKYPSLTALERSERYRLPLLAHLVRHFRPEGGLHIQTDSQAPAGAGIGGSSAMAIALCAGLSRLTGRGLDRLGWIRTSRDVEAVVIGIPTGTQDYYPAAFGGLTALHLEAGEQRREPLPADPRTLEQHLVLCYTGRPRKSAINNWAVFVAHMDGDRRVRHNLAAIASIARQMRNALAGQDWREVGRLMREEWAFRRRNLPTISTPLIDRIMASALRRGAIAGKVCGAGGGGCVTLVIEPGARSRVEQAIREAGATLLPFRMDRKGVRVSPVGKAPSSLRNHIGVKYEQ